MSRIWFQDPDSREWHMLRWEHANAVGGPFSNEALAYARQLAIASDLFPETRRALAELLKQWGAGLVGDRAGRRSRPAHVCRSAGSLPSATAERSPLSPGAWRQPQ